MIPTGRTITKQNLEKWIGFYKTDDFNGDIKARIITNMIQTNGILGHCILYIYIIYVYCC
jgi:hypothetical protein